MAVGDYMRSGYGLKQRVTILTVDPVSRKIEASLKDGGLIEITSWDVPSTFRWPVEGEQWTVRKKDGYWSLDTHNPEYYHSQIDDMNPGDLRLDSVGKVWLADSGLSVPRKYTQIIGDNINTIYIVSHFLNTPDVIVSIRSNSLPTDLLDNDIVQITDENSVTITFGVIPPRDSYVVTIIG